MLGKHSANRATFPALHTFIAHLLYLPYRYARLNAQMSPCYCGPQYPLSDATSRNQARPQAQACSGLYHWGLCQHTLEGLTRTKPRTRAFLSVVKKHTIVIYPREEIKASLPMKTCPQMFIAALLVIAHSHKQPKQLSTDERFAERGASLNNRPLFRSKRDAIDTCASLDGAQRHFC